MTPVCQANVVILEALDLKEWRGCLVSLGRKAIEGHLEWTASRACWDLREGPASQESRERLDSLESLV